jgi:hypothetical protein
MKQIQTSLAKVGNLRQAVKVILALAALLLLAGTVLASNGYEITRYVIASGGGPAEVVPYALNGTVGQPVVGVDSNAPYQLCSGFWGCGGAGEYKIYLPVILRNFQ